MSAHICATCAHPVDRDLVDITTMGDAANGVSKRIWGHWERCGNCGSTAEPMLAVDDTDILTVPFDRDQPIPVPPGEQEWAQTYREAGYDWCGTCAEWHRPPECHAVT